MTGKIQSRIYSVVIRGRQAHARKLLLTLIG